MFLSPIRSTDPDDRRAWDNCTLWDAGTFYAFFNTTIMSRDHGYGLDVAVSEDGVAWRWIGRDLLPIQGAHAGYGIAKTGETFVYYPTCTNADGEVHFKIYESADCVEWSYLGASYDVYPDRRYYRERWDELCILEDHDETGAVYYGYISAEVCGDIGPASLGMLESRDARDWRVLPPPVIDWGDIPVQHMEVNFCERIDGRYYLSLSGRLYMDSLGYSLYTFVGDSPHGPFRPDVSAFRLCGTSSRDTTWLGHPIHTPDGLLIALWFSSDQTLEIPSRNLSIGPLMRLVAADGHLRLKYWEQTDRAKGEVIPLPVADIRRRHPSLERADRAASVAADEKSVNMRAGRDGIVVRFKDGLDLSSGFVFEASMRVTEKRQGIETHQLPARAGFVFGTDKVGSGYAIMFETLGVTKAGMLNFADTPITDHDRYAHAGSWLADHRSGTFQGTVTFAIDDVVGPLGHASFAGVRHGVDHRVRLICRSGFALVFIDDFYVQTYALPDTFDGSLAAGCFDGMCRFEGFAMWKLDVRQEG